MSFLSELSASMPSMNDGDNDEEEEEEEEEEDDDDDDDEQQGAGGRNAGVAVGGDTVLGPVTRGTPPPAPSPAASSPRTVETDEEVAGLTAATTTATNSGGNGGGGGGGGGGGAEDGAGPATSPSRSPVQPLTPTSSAERVKEEMVREWQMHVRYLRHCLAVQAEEQRLEAVRRVRSEAAAGRARLEAQLRRARQAAAARDRDFKAFVGKVKGDLLYHRDKVSAVLARQRSKAAQEASTRRQLEAEIRMLTEQLKVERQWRREREQREE